jgi:peroxiredoxin
MARNDDHTDLGKWVDDRLATLTTDVDWDPSVPRGLARLRSESDRPRRRWTLWIVAAATASVLLFVPTPALRAFAHSCGEFVARNLPGAAGRTARASLRPVVPDLALTDQDGGPVTLSSLRGKVVLLTFWTTTCGQCQAEMPWFTEFQQADREQGLVVVGVSLDEGGWLSVRPYVEHQPIKYRVLVGDRDLARPTVGSSIPTTLILDKEGRVAVRHVGFCSKAEYQRDIQKILAE